MGLWHGIALGARITQAIFSIIVLGLCAFVVSDPVVFDLDTGNFFRLYYPQANFMIFVAVWSLLVVGFQILVPRFSDKLGHKFVVLGLDALTALFWFAGFIALSVSIGSLNLSPGDLGELPTYLANWIRDVQAACAFGAFAWVSFMITTVLSAINVFRGNTGSAKHGHDMGVA